MKKTMLIKLAFTSLALVSCYSYPATRFEEVSSLPGQPGVKLIQPDSKMSELHFARFRDDVWGVLQGDVRWRNMWPYFTIMERRLIHFGIVDGRMRVIQQAVPLHSEAMGRPGWRGVRQGLFPAERGFLIVYLTGDDLVSCEYDYYTRKIVNHRRIGSVAPELARGTLAIEHHGGSIYLFLKMSDSVSLVRADLAEGKAAKVKEYPLPGGGDPVINSTHAGRAGMYVLMSAFAGDRFQLYYDSWDGAVHSERKIEFPATKKAVAADYHPGFHETEGGVNLVIDDGKSIWRKRVTGGEGVDSPYEKVYSSTYSNLPGQDALIGSISCTDADCYALISSYSTGKKELLSFKRGTKKDVTSFGPIIIQCLGSSCLCENHRGEITFLPGGLLE